MNVNKRLLIIARITAFTPVILNAVIYFTIQIPIVFGSVPGAITAGVAWFLPSIGGLLMLLLSIPGFYLLFESNWNFQQKIPVYVFCIIFIASGFLHIIAAWLGRRTQRIKNKDND
jgi:hypothetical protein